MARLLSLDYLFDHCQLSTMLTKTLGALCELTLDEIGTEYARYRVPDADGERAMHGSMLRYGQVSPVVCWLREGQPELLDGFKRLHAAQQLKMTTLAGRWIEVDERTAKVAIYGLNRVNGCMKELEEAWIVHALVRDDKMTQVEVAELIDHHKSWVCRRLQLIEKLSDQVLSDLRLGLLTATAARQLVRLPDGNQDEVLEVARRESLTARELQGVVDLWVASPDRSQKEYILADPRRAVGNARAIATPAFDPRLSKSGNRVSKRLGVLLDLLARMHNWVRHRSGDDLMPADMTVLAPSFERLVKESSAVAELCQACILKKEIVIDE